MERVLLELDVDVDVADGGIRRDEMLQDLCSVVLVLVLLFAVALGWNM